MTSINPVDLTTLGARVTDPAQLTEGRWYVVRVNCRGYTPLVHAKYLGMKGRASHAFEVCDEDHLALKRSLGLAKRIHRDNGSIRSGKIDGGGICEIFKFKQATATRSNAPQPTATLSTVDQFKSEIDALRAKATQKRDQIAQLSEEIAGINIAIYDTRKKLKASLEGYI
ncbi:hypothetical protein PGT2_g00011 [Escherichia phage PGT2]|uniref:Uncharacterized protein n=1 Tax=Escherichia phage PGT2 TaxID=2047782 RepID=A0A2D2W2Z7_9CAUD|nr:hypothetical protein HOS43_gp11 [Escherichia phage PGT2]ATS92429.1 hypothetical protein PGT2_g00011 [Escherichia phage PGT2]